MQKIQKKQIIGQEEYYSQDLGKVWSYPKYDNYKNAKWKWGHFPFSNNFESIDFFHPIITKPIKNISILEIGSARGGAYKFLKNSKLIDMNDYTGIEVSNSGYNYCKNNFPNTKWINADFTKYKFQRKYDYAYERISVHHMPDPLAQYDKILANTSKACMFSFRGCIFGPTISDLNKAHFYEQNGKYYCNIINVLELIMLGLKNNFKDIRILFGGLHEPFIRDEDEAKKNFTSPYLHKSINVKQKAIARFQVRFRKHINNKNILRIYLTAHPLKIAKNPFLIYKLLSAMMNLKNSWKKTHSK